MKTRILALVCAIVTATASWTASASTVTVGNPAIDRTNFDSFNDFGLIMGLELFPEGTVTSWDVYVKQVGASADLGLMSLSSLGGAYYKVEAIDYRSGLSTGFNSFVSSLSVKAGDILGLYIGDAKVAYSVPGSTDAYTANSSLVSTPSVGQIIEATGFVQRDYSLQAHVVPVPLPASAVLLLAGLGGLVAVRRRRRS